MHKKIRMSKHQLDEIVGTDIDYLNNGNFKEYNGNSETSVSGKIDSTKSDGRPITTDEIGQFTNVRGYFGTRDTTPPINQKYMS